MTRAIDLTSAVIVMLALSGARAAAAQSLPDNDNGRYVLSQVPDGVIRLDTRTGAVSTCNNSGAGWAVTPYPTSTRRMTRKSAGCRRRMKSPKPKSKD